ncbi:MAG: urate hydroxylase PuuD [Acidobacteria bacterium]|nr:urate hydroxylase PuuD [Acidobacteriota bacterium]
MLIESSAHLPVALAFADDLFHSPTGKDIARILLRWSHFVFGITWIGLLYFFNLVNVPFQKEIDAETKKKANPSLLSRSLWYFRWGAVGTVLVGLTYYAMYILSGDVKNVNAIGGKDVNIWLVLIVWLLFPIIAFAIEYAIIMKVPALTKDGRVFAVVVAVLVILMAWGILWWLSSQLSTPRDSFASNRTLSIGVGGALGLIMLLNVWGIIWPLQKRIIAGIVSGNAAPPEFARRAFLASRTNTWLSLPMLFFMATSHGDWVIFGKNSG